MHNSMEEIKEYAKALGINSLSKYKNKEDLIHTIQLAEGYTDCFRKIPDCAVSRCKWHEDCLGEEELTHPVFDAAGLAALVVRKIKEVGARRAHASSGNRKRLAK